MNDATVILPSEYAQDVPKRAVDPIDALATKTAKRCGLAIDPLQIAAMLESDGMTDRMAVVDYGYTDVFALAEEVYRRIPRRGASAAHRNTSRAQTVREISHGLLYVLPSAMFPAVAHLLGTRQTVTGMVFATAVGWVWSMGLIWVAYRMVGYGRTDLAARTLRWGLLLGISVPVLLGALFLPGPTLLLAGAQLCTQLAGGVLLFHKREPVMFALALPAVAVGLCYVFTGSDALAIATIAASLTSAILTGVLALVETSKVAPVKEPHITIRSEIPKALPIVGYAALSALFLLSVDARLSQTRLDLALAVTPIVMGMGVLEWRARRFGERSAKLLRQTQYPAQFRRQVVLTFATDLAVAVGILAALAILLGVFLYARGQLSWLGAGAIAGHVVLGGGYFAGFLLINQGRFGRLLGVLGGVVAGYLGAVMYLGPSLQIHVFAACSAVLLVGLVVGLLPDLGQVWRYAS